MKENLIDYTYRRGSITLEESPLNEVDALILSVLIYRRFESLPSYGKGKTLKELYAPLCPLQTENKDTRLFKSVRETERLSSLILDDYEYSLSKENKSEEQFACGVFSEGDGIIGYVILRGTDSSITGWKEDLNMAYEDVIPSEIKALAFLERISSRYEKIIIMGHSKGGTLALYSALKAEESVFNKIKEIYVFDAPGLPDKTISTPRWHGVIKKSQSFVPSSSIFGVMFNTIPNPRVVKADAIGVLQHDAFSWRISGETFAFEKDISTISRLHGEALRLFFQSSTQEERETVVSVIHKVLSSVKEENVFHIPIVIIEHLDLFNKEIASLTKEEKEVLKKLVRTLRESRRKGYKALKEEIDGKKKNKNTALRIIFLLLSLVVIFFVLCYITPSESEVGLESRGEIEELEIPIGPDDSIVVSHTGYTLSYCEEYELPYWVAYKLTKENLSSSTVSRDDNFREDESIYTGSAALSDYRKSGYDRGHMAPAADFKWSEDAMSDTFYLSNMCPQTHSFNAGIWSDLESAVRSIAYDEGEVYVVTGPVLTDGPYETIGENGVAIPNYFYKVILDYTEPEIKAIGFIMPHENSSLPLSYFAVTVDEVEEITNIDFFPLLPDDIEEVVESEVDATLWELRPFSFSSETVDESALEYTSSTEETTLSDTAENLLALFNRNFYLLKKEIFNALGITSYMRSFGFI